MHKYVSSLFVTCAKTFSLYSGQKPQHFMCGVTPSLYAPFTKVIRSTFTAKFGNFNLLNSTYTHFPQDLLKELRINKLIEGI